MSYDEITTKIATMDAWDKACPKCLTIYKHPYFDICLRCKDNHEIHMILDRDMMNQKVMEVAE